MEAYLKILYKCGVRETRNHIVHEHYKSDMKTVECEEQTIDTENHTSD